jgi:hypothetical protein
VRVPDTETDCELDVVLERVTDGVAGGEADCACDTDALCVDDGVGGLERVAACELLTDEVADRDVDLDWEVVGEPVIEPVCERELVAAPDFVLDCDRVTLGVLVDEAP